MLRIWKYILPDNNIYPKVKIPQGGHILCFKFQNKIPCIWAFVDIEKPEEERKFFLGETGQSISIDPNYLKYIGSDQFETEVGPYVGHLFEFVQRGKGTF